MSIKSPAQLEIDLKRVEMRVSRWLAQNFSYYGVLIIVPILIAGIYFFDLHLLENSYRPNGGYHVLRMIRWTILAAIAGSPIILMWRRRWIEIVQALMMISLWTVVVVTFFRKLDQATIVLVFVSVPAYCLGGWFYLKNAAAILDYRKLGAILYTLFFLFIFTVVSVRLYESNEDKFIFYWHLKSIFILLSILYTGLAHNPSESEALIALNPLNSMRGTLWPIGSAFEEDLRSRKIIWYQGALNIFNGYVVAVFRAFLEGHWDQMMVNSYLRYSGRYILAILGIISFLNILTGVARLLGYRVKDATEFVWLSRTPAEYWRRGAVYHYMFIYRFVYIPLIRLIKNPWLSSAIAFFIFLINKTSVLDTVYFVGEKFGVVIPVSLHDINYLNYIFILWILWFVVLRLSQWWPLGRKSRTSPLNSWMSVILTHLVMSSLYYLAYLIQNLMEKMS